MTSVYQAPLRPRLSPAFAAILRDALGRRDFTKGERGTLNELLVSLRGLAAHADFPSLPLTEGDDEQTRALKHRKLDGLARLLSEKSELLTDHERELLPRLLSEAATDFRPHTGHERATPTHVVEARRAQADRSPPPASDERVSALESRFSSLDAKLDLLLAALPAPATAPSASPPVDEEREEKHTSTHRRR